MLSGTMARVFQLPQSRGILVQRVASQSPAAKLGIVAGDREGDDRRGVGSSSAAT
jgi:S1-C subfamily serine protease